MLPYPGKYESHNSWMRRCDEYDSNRRRWNAEQNARNTNWGGYNYIPVKKNVEYTFPDGRKVLAVKVISGWSRSHSARENANKKGLKFEEVRLPKKSIAGRREYVFYKKDAEILNPLLTNSGIKV